MTHQQKIKEFDKKFPPQNRHTKDEEEWLLAGDMDFGIVGFNRRYFTTGDINAVGFNSKDFTTGDIKSSLTQTKLEIYEELRSWAEKMFVDLDGRREKLLKQIVGNNDYLEGRNECIQDILSHIDQKIKEIKQ